MKTGKTAAAGLILLLLLFMVTGPTLAQRATLNGKVTDQESGDTLPGANVAVTSAAVQTGASTNTQGVFEVSVEPGTYTVTVTYIGYETKVISDITVTAGETRTIDVALVGVGLEFNPITVSASRRAEKTLEAPASISVLEVRELSHEVAPSTDAVLRNVTGIDMAQTGIDRREIVLRGFNNAFSGATYILTDYRRASVPSLDVNLHAIMPNITIDLEKVEIVRGPGSALYGAGVDAGVIHYLTKDPFDSRGTIASFSGGERTSIAGHFRHAGVIGERVGYKLTAQYAQADDWQYNINDSLDREQLLNPVTGDTTVFDRDYQKVNVNGLVEYRFSDDLSLSLNGGYSHLDATLLSGIGTVQADNYGYTYGQLRLQAGRFFAQAYVNKNDAGDSFVYGQQQASGQSLPVVDNSTLLNLQAQYDLEFAEGKEQMIFGVDYDRTTPETDSTIYGRNEQDDLLSEFGVYAQSLTKISPKLDLTIALRLDKNNVEDNVQLSPRAAVVFKPTPKHNFRVTYNRAYALPGGNSLFLDIIGRRIDLAPGVAIIQRGRGSKDGYTFNNARAGGGITASGLLPGIFGQNFTYSGPGGTLQNTPLAVVYGLVYNSLKNIPPQQIQALLVANGFPQLPIPVIQQLITLLSPVPVAPGVPTTNVSGLGTSVLTAAPVDVEPLKSTITHTIEAGYKGLLGERILFAIDGYYTKKKNFVSGVQQLTPLAVFNRFTTELAPALAAAIQANQPLAAALQAAGATPQQVAGIIAGLAQQGDPVPVSVVQPDQNQVPGEILGVYRNFGDIDFWGIDASLQFKATNRLDLFGNLSYVSDDFFDDDELGEAGSGLELALNASALKIKGGFNYAIPQGLSFNGAARYTQGFPVNSGPYIGDVEDYFLIDVGAGYDLGRFARGMRVDLTIQNILNNEHREFIGAPEIGRLALARISYELH